MSDSDAFASAHELLAELVHRDPRERTEDPDDPSTVQAMQMVLHLPKQDPPPRNQVLVDAARAVVAVCLDERAGEPGAWRDGLRDWYSYRIRKVARRARGAGWDGVQALPGVTVGGARAFVPSPVSDVPHAVSKLQIKGTELDDDQITRPFDPGAPLIVVDASLEMSLGKAAAQVGHASMLYAAQLPCVQARSWAQTGFALNVREVGGAEFRERAAGAGAVPVRDAGFTEVAPGSVTVVALPPEHR